MLPAASRAYENRREMLVIYHRRVEAMLAELHTAYLLHAHPITNATAAAAIATALRSLPDDPAGSASVDPAPWASACLSADRIARFRSSVPAATADAAAARVRAEAIAVLEVLSRLDTPAAVESVIVHIAADQDAALRAAAALAADGDTADGTRWAPLDWDGTNEAAAVDPAAEAAAAAFIAEAEAEATAAATSAHTSAPLSSAAVGGAGTAVPPQQPVVDVAAAALRLLADAEGRAVALERPTASGRPAGVQHLDAAALLESAQRDAMRSAAAVESRGIAGLTGGATAFADESAVDELLAASAAMAAFEAEEAAEAAAKARR